MINTDLLWEAIGECSRKASQGNTDSCKCPQRSLSSGPEGFCHLAEMLEKQCTFHTSRGIMTHATLWYVVTTAINTLVCNRRGERTNNITAWEFNAVLQRTLSLAPPSQNLFGVVDPEGNVVKYLPYPTLDRSKLRRPYWTYTYLKAGKCNLSGIFLRHFRLKTTQRYG